MIHGSACGQEDYRREFLQATARYLGLEAALVAAVLEQTRSGRAVFGRGDKGPLAERGAWDGARRDSLRRIEAALDHG